MVDLFRGAENVSRTIQLILAPVVMITACGIILGGLLSRYASINDRLRQLNRERLDCLRSHLPDRLIIERIAQIDQQMPDLMRRLKMQHDAVLTLYLSILVFIFDMFTIAAAALIDLAWAGLAALVVFLMGVTFLGIAIMIVAREVSHSLTSVLYEARQVGSIKHEVEHLHDHAEKTSDKV